MLSGLGKVLRFNWPYYLVAGLVIGGALWAAGWVESSWGQHLCLALAILVIGASLASLLATAWVYDFSTLYRLPWLVRFAAARDVGVFHAGFDELASTLPERIPAARVSSFDFFDPTSPREASILRARASQAQQAQVVDGAALPLPDQSLDLALLFLAAHEIRRREPRVRLFAEIRRCLRDQGRVICVEHLRDAWNFAAYNFACFHFLPRSEWLATFEAAGLRVTRTDKQTPLITVFELEPA